MVFYHCLVLEYEGLPKGVPSHCGGVILFSQQRGILLASLWSTQQEGSFALTYWPVHWPLGRISGCAGQTAGLSQPWGTNDWSNGAVISWHGGWVLQAVLFLFAWVSKGAEWLKWEWMYWSYCCYENDTHKLFLQEGEHTAGEGNLPVTWVSF